MARILIVEDTPGNMLLTSIVLESEGHTLFCADRALPGIEIAEQEALDLILMDVQLPNWTGPPLLPYSKAIRVPAPCRWSR